MSYTDLRDFAPEYTAVTEDGIRVEVEKLGGGTLGRKYTGTWRYRVIMDGKPHTQGQDFETGTPHTHRWVADTILSMIFEHLPPDDVDESAVETAHQIMEYLDRLRCQAVYAEILRAFGMSHHLAYGVVHDLCTLTEDGTSWLFEMRDDLNKGWTSGVGPTVVTVPPANPPIA